MPFSAARHVTGHQDHSTITICSSSSERCSVDTTQGTYPSPSPPLCFHSPPPPPPNRQTGNPMSRTDLTDAILDYGVQSSPSLSSDAPLSEEQRAAQRDSVPLSIVVVPDRRRHSGGE